MPGQHRNPRRFVVAGWACRFAAVLLLVCLVGVNAVEAEGGPAPGDGYVEVPGGFVWYRVVGAGPGVPLLVLHGGPGGTSCGLTPLEALGAQRPVIRYDQLGSGRSTRPEDMTLWTAERFVEELDDVRAALGLERMHLLGHSWGAGLAAAYVLEKGSAGIVSLTLSSPLLSTPLWIADATLLREQLPEDVQLTLTRHELEGSTDAPEYEAATEAFYRRFMYAGDKPPERPACVGAPWNPVIYQYMWGPTEFFATGNLLEFDLTPQLPELRLPVLFLTGEFDEARPQTVAGFQALVPGARFEIIPGAGHATLSKSPELYRRILAEFLAAAETSAR